MRRSACSLILRLTGLLMNQLHQESTKVTVPSSNDGLECPNNKFLVVLQSFTENLPDVVRFHEAMTNKNLETPIASVTLCLRGGVISAFANAYKPAVVKVHAHQRTLYKSTSYKYSCKHSTSYNSVWLQTK